MTELEYFGNYFKKVFKKYKSKKIVIYGTGFRSKIILEEFKEFNIIGVLDGVKNNGTFCDKKILSLKETEELKPDIIIIIAQLKSTEIIFQRIGKFCLNNDILLFDMHGRNLFEVYEINQYCVKNESFFEVSDEQLREEILKHDIVSFDIFDTLIMRKTLVPKDVFEIVEERAKQNGIDVFNFKMYRIQAEVEISHTSPNIYEIYENLQRIMKISEDEKITLLNLELDIEKSVIIPRKKSIELFEFAISESKNVYLISDMYLPKNILVEILGDLGIKSYVDIFVSCEYHLAKCNGLFQVFKEKVSGDSYLHIGDNEESDGIFGVINKIDVFLIKSAYDMLKISSYKNILNDLNNINERSLVGLYISKIFNNPFALYKTNGRPMVDNIYDFGYMFISPLITTFMIWLEQELNQNEYEDILFSARDGYLIQQLYNYMKEVMKLDQLPKGIYFETSRALCIKACIESDEDIEWICKLPFAGSPEKMLETHFEINWEEIIKYDENKYETIFEYALEHKKLIYDNSARVRENYLKYMENIGFKNEKKYALFDFVSTGTCQYPLSKIAPIELEGLYFCRYLTGDEIKNKLPIKSLFMNGHIFYVAESYVIENYLLLETIITSLKPSLMSIDENGVQVYCEETRSLEELEYVKIMHNAITDFFKEYIEIMFVTNQKIDKNISDKLYSFKDSRYTDEQCSIFNNLFLKDDFGQGKIRLLRKN